MTKLFEQSHCLLLGIHCFKKINEALARNDSQSIAAHSPINVWIYRQSTMKVNVKYLPMHDM